MPRPDIYYSSTGFIFGWKLGAIKEGVSGTGGGLTFC